MKEHFERFKQQYDRIICTKQNQANSHEKLKAFILTNSKIFKLFNRLEDFSFFFDDQKQKLIFRFIGGIYNAEASEILYFFRRYDNQSVWHLLPSIEKTIRTFELNLEKAGDKFLDDFKSFVDNPQVMEINVENLSPRPFNVYIPPEDNTNPQQAKLNEKNLSAKTFNAPVNNYPNARSNAHTLLKFAGLFAIGAVLATQSDKIPTSVNEFFSKFT